MIAYRPHRGGLGEAMALAQVFVDESATKAHIVKYWDGLIKYEDIVIEDKPFGDERIGWRDSRYVCTNRCGADDYLKLYGCPQALGHCATDFDPF